MDGDNLYIVSPNQFDFRTRDVINYTSSHIAHYEIVESDLESAQLERTEIENLGHSQRISIYRATLERLYGQ